MLADKGAYNWIIEATCFRRGTEETKDLGREAVSKKEVKIKENILSNVTKSACTIYICIEQRIKEYNQLCTQIKTQLKNTNIYITTRTKCGIFLD